MIYLDSIANRSVSDMYNHQETIDLGTPVMSDGDMLYFIYDGDRYYLHEMYTPSIDDIIDNLNDPFYSLVPSEMVWSMLNAGIDDLVFRVYDKTVVDGRVDPDNFRHCHCSDSSVLIKNRMFNGRRGWMTLMSNDRTFSKSYYFSDFVNAIGDGLIIIEHPIKYETSQFHEYMKKHGIPIFGTNSIGVV